MTHISPAAFCVWSVLSTTLGAFLVGHLWRFDRFRCLRWSNSAYSGAFKRIMTYTYLITIPCIMIYSFGFAYIKYKEGYMDLAGLIIVRPYSVWSLHHRRMIYPLMMVFSFAWSFEMITHLEELCFWLFLITAGPQQPDWFKSPFFRLWAVGSAVAFLYLPAITIGYHSDPLNCEARIFTAGSIGDLVLTLAFIPILMKFPAFLRKVKAEGVDSTIIIRLHKFFELNIPLLILGADGVHAHHHVNESMFWTDLLSMVAALGCVVSSVCTILIFFPRSFEAEFQVKQASAQRSAHTQTSWQQSGEQPRARRVEGRENYEEEEDDDDEVKPSRFDDMPYHYGVKPKKSFTKTERARSLLRLPASIKRIAASQHRANSPVSIPSLPFTSNRHDQEEADELECRVRRQNSQASSLGGQSSEVHLQRKNTYLLTNSPVLRSQRLQEEEAERNKQVRRVEYPPDPNMAGNSYRHEIESRHNVPTSRVKENNKDKDDLVIDQRVLSPFATPPPAAISLPAEYGNREFGARSPGTVRSNSTTRTSRRRLPTPPEPNAPAPAYYPPGEVPPEEQYQPDVKIPTSPSHTSPTTYYSENALSPTRSHPLEASGATLPILAAASGPRPTYLRETSDAPLMNSLVSAAANSVVVEVGAQPGRSRSKRTAPAEDDGGEHGSREASGRPRVPARGAGPLTAANVDRHNDMIGRGSNLNPLIRTFNSPIDFLDRPVPSGNRSRRHRGERAV